MTRLKLLLAMAGAAGLLHATAVSISAATPSPPAIGDPCLVGHWVLTQETAPGNWTWANEVIAVKGLAGLTIDFTADGTETDNYNATRPLVGDYHGHKVEIVLRGTVFYHTHADGHQIVQSSVAPNVTVTFYYDGVLQPGGYVSYTATTNSYVCSATQLRLISPPTNPGYGDELDDLTRPAASGAGGGAGSVVSTFGSTLPTPAQVLAAPLKLLISALIALALVLLVTFPSNLFNRTYEENHETIRAWWERRVPWLHRLRASAAARGPQAVRDGISYAVVISAGGVLAALLDPRFGLNLRTLALFAGAVFALLAGSVFSAIAAGTYRLARHRPGPWHLEALPSGLLVAALCVFISRVTAFEPGYLYGLIGGVVFARALSSHEEGHVVAVTSIVTIAVAIAAWIAWVPVAGFSSAHPTSFGWALASNFLAALFVSGMVGLVVGLVPLRFLPGEKLARWHRGAWGAVFGLAALSLIEVILRPQSAGAHVSSVPFWTTAGLFVGFGIASVSFWAYFKVRKQTAQTAVPASAPSGED